MKLKLIFSACALLFLRFAKQNVEIASMKTGKSGNGFTATLYKRKKNKKQKNENKK